MAVRATARADGGGFIPLLREGCPAAAGLGVSADRPGELVFIRR